MAGQYQTLNIRESFYVQYKLMRANYITICELERLYEYNKIEINMQACFMHRNHGNHPAYLVVIKKNCYIVLKNKSKSFFKLRICTTNCGNGNRLSLDFSHDELSIFQ